MKIKQIFGRMTAYIPCEDMEDAEGEFFPCSGEEFDIIFYDPKCETLQQTLLHEEIHGLIFRTGIYQTSISKDVIEALCENISVFITETYEIKDK